MRITVRLLASKCANLFSGMSHPAKYLLSVAGGGVFVIIAFLCMLGMLQSTNALSPPPFINSLCADVKLEYLREHPPSAPNVLIVGSSVALRNLDSSVIARAYPGARPLNGGMCGLQSHQTAFATHFFLARYPTIRAVLLILDPFDARTCTTETEQLFDEDSVSAYLSRRDWLVMEYFHYFDVKSLLRNAKRIKEQRENKIPLDPVIFDEFGDGPMADDAGGEGLIYSGLKGQDPKCFDVLRNLANSVIGAGRSFLVSTSPLNPDWVQLYDPAGTVLGDFADRVSQALAGTGGQFWDGARRVQIPSDGFADAVHLRWSGAAQFSLGLEKATRFGSMNQVE